MAVFTYFKHKIMQTTFLYTITLLIVNFNFAQETGSISGVVVDGEFGDGLAGANVLIEGEMLGAAADMNGLYSINNIKPGAYTLIFSMIGYQVNKVTNVEVKAGKTIKIDIVMNAQAYETDAVEITAKALTNTEASLLSHRQKSVSVSDAISAEEITKSGSGDAASAMTKVTGASVVGGKYIYVRGLGERYSTTTINGAELPSADPDKKSFQLDLIPSNMLNNINTIKTFTPDKPGTFTGGLVDVTLKSYPEKFTVSVNTSVGYNSIATNNENFILGNSGGTDWLGIDDGTREMPKALNGGKIDIPRISAVKTKEQAAYLDKISKSFNKEMKPKAANALPNSSFGLSIGNTTILNKNNSIGYFGSLTWGQNYSFVDNGEVGRFKLVGNLNDVSGLESEFSGIDIKGIRSVDWGVIGNIAFKNPGFGEIKLSYMRTQSGESTGRYMYGVRDRDRTTASSSTTFETRVVSWQERNLNNFQIDGEHQISSLNNMKFEWKASYSKNEQIEPDQRYFFNVYNVQPDGNKYYSFDAANSQPISRYFRDLGESNFSTQANISIPFNVWKNLSAKIKTGFSFSEVNREYNQRRFDYDMNNLILNDYAGDIDALFNNVGIIDSLSRPSRPNRWFGITIDNEAIQDSTNYFRGDSKMQAFYAMIDIPLIDRLRFVGGFRYETTLMNSRTLDNKDEKGTLDNKDFLPSLNFIYTLSENMNLRLAYTNTIARPTFRELAPYQSFEFVGDFLYKGNPNLKRTQIKNYDIRWEWFLNPGEITAFSVFYKDFTNPIESFIDPTFSDDNALRSVKNVDNARVYGFELEARKDLGFISGSLNSFKISTNFSYVVSEVDIPKEDIEEKKANGDINPDKTRPFAGQSPYLFNFNLSYENTDSKTSAGLYYYVFGDRLFLTGRFATPDVYERGYSTLDLKTSQGIGNNFIVALSIKNILNPAQIFSYRLNNNLVDKEFIYSSIKRGITYSISLTYNL
ncbi:MAG: TonB-dependent receptor [Ignavibacteria bacterium]|nr:TonB-dependent receptor [Ignavibacteria bacterium]